MKNSIQLEEILQTKEYTHINANESLLQNISKKQKQIQITFQDKCKQLEDIYEQIIKSIKSINNYLINVENEGDNFSKSLLKSSKKQQNSINWQTGRNFLQLVHNFSVLTGDLSQKIQDIQQKNKIFIAENITSYIEYSKNGFKQMSERTILVQKNLHFQKSEYNKQQQKYSKQCKEVDISISDLKNGTIDIRLCYNLAFFAKQYLKIKETIKDCESQELKLTQTIEEGNSYIGTLPSHIQEHYKQMKVIFKNSIEKVIDSIGTIQKSQACLSQFCNQYVQEKSLNKDDYAIQESEHQIIQQRLLLINSDSYSPGINFIPLQQALNKKDTELKQSQYNQYPEAAGIYIDTFEQIIQERKQLIKSVRDFLNECKESLEQYCSAIDKENLNLKKLCSQFTSKETILELFGLIFKNIMDQQFQYIEQMHQLCAILTASIKQIDSCLNDQQQQSTSFFNMSKKQFGDYQKTLNKAKWVIETNSFLGTSLDYFKTDEQKRLLMIRDILIKISKHLQKVLQVNTDVIQDQLQNHANLKSNIEKQIESVLQPYQAFDNVLIASDHIYEYQKQIKVSEEFYKFIDDQTKKNQNFGDETPNSPEQKIEQKSKNSATFTDQSENSKICKNSLMFGADKSLFIDSFNCAFYHKILLQGKMYVYQDKIGFHSYFNSQSFVGHTILCIPFADIVKFEKRKNAFVFDNSIALFTKKGELFFTSYIKRDDCFTLLSQILEGKVFVKEIQTENNKKSSDDNVKKSKKHSRNSVDFDSENKAINFQSSTSEQNIQQSSALERQKSNDNQLEHTTQITQITTNLTDQKEQIEPINSVIQQNQNEWIEERRKNHSSLSLFESNKEYFTQEIEINDISTKEIFQQIFSEKKYKSENNKEYSQFMYYFFEEHQKDTEIVFQPIEPQPPSYFNDINCEDISNIQQFQPYSQREYNLVHPVREKIPFGPKVCYCQTKEKFYFISDKEIVIEREIFMSKIPYCDYFTVRIQFKIVQTNQEECIKSKIQFKVYVNFIKSTTFKGRIESGTINENKEVWNINLVPQIQLNLENYIKTKVQAQFDQSNPKITKKQKKLYEIQQQYTEIQTKQKENDEKIIHISKTFNNLPQLQKANDFQFDHISYLIIVLVLLNVFQVFYN